MGMRTSLLLTALLLTLTACNCGKGTMPVDAGQGSDSGTPLTDAGFDAGQGGRDAGSADAGTDAGRPELTITGLLPPRGSTGGGTSVVLTGSGFLRSVASTGSIAAPLTSLKIGSNPVLTFQILDDQTVELLTPPGLAGAANVSYGNPNGHFICNGCFTYFDELAVTGLSPAEGPVEGGTVVTITGQGFTAATQVLFGGNSSPGISVLSATQLTAVVPRGAAPGLVDVAV